MITKIRTQPTLFQRVYRHEAGFACLLVLALFVAMGLMELICTITGVGAQ
jgi:hypothetical protein